jgi:hypothetical protein
MTTSLRHTLDFLLYQWLGAETLQQRPRLLRTIPAKPLTRVLDTCERIAREKYAPFNRLVDTQEPHFDGEKVISCRSARMMPTAPMPNRACCERGAQDYDEGGMQLPCTDSDPGETAANSFFAMAGGTPNRSRSARVSPMCHSRETFDAVLDTCERIAREKYAPGSTAWSIPRSRAGSNDGSLRVVLPLPRCLCRPACWPPRRTTRTAACSCPTWPKRRPKARRRSVAPTCSPRATPTC